MISDCSDCGRRLFFYERVHLPQAFCRRRAGRRGITRLCDRQFYANVAMEAASRVPWWRWTVYLFFAVGHDVSIADAHRAGIRLE